VIAVVEASCSLATHLIISTPNCGLQNKPY
jgi:hypothetical protein